MKICKSCKKLNLITFEYFMQDIEKCSNCGYWNNIFYCMKNNQKIVQGNLDSNDTKVKITR